MSDPPVAPVTALPKAEAEEQDGQLRDYVAVLAGQRWLVLGLVALAVLAGVAYALLATPLYRSHALIQIEERSDARLGTGVQQLTDMFALRSPAEAEIEILRSSALLESVVERLHLDIQATPAYLPILGAAWARHHDGEGLQPAPLGLGRWAWGGERIAVPRLQVPPRLEGRPLTLTALEGSRWVLRGPGGEVLVEGEVGQPAVAGGVGLLVSELRARPGTRFRLGKTPLEETIENLDRRLAIAERGMKTGIIAVELTGPDPERNAAVVDAIAQAYVRQNVQRKSEEAEKTLAFVDAQLPDQRAKVEAAERALNQYQSQNGSVDVPMETSALIDRETELEKAITELRLQKAELGQRFTDQHHLVLGVNQRLGRLEAERAGIEGRIKKLPDAELQSVRLMRDVRVANELYVLLLNKAQELKVVKSGTIGNVRLVDPARVAIKPFRPRLATVLPISLGLGLFLGVAVAFLRNALTRGLDDPEALEAAAGVPVYASIPHSRSQEQRARRRSGAAPGGSRVLAAQDPDDLAVESIRSLRTNLQFALAEAASNVLVVSGPGPGVGKSFVCVNLAQVVADAGRSVLVVDGDIRKGKLHRQYGLADRAPGLSDVIIGTVPLDTAIRRDTGTVHVLPTGTLPPNPSELLMSSRFGAVVEELRGRYDLVLIDTPPCLAVTDPSVIARRAGVTLLVFRAGQHPVREVQQAVKRMAQASVRLHGLVFNDVVHLPGRYGYASTYAYEYRREPQRSWPARLFPRPTAR